MKVLSFSSINIDYVYHLNDFVKEGETLPCNNLDMLLGGKGANQSIAAKIAGVENIYHFGKVGQNDKWLIDDMKKFGVESSLIKTVDGPSGHAIIQMNSEGHNSIITFAGANHMVTKEDIDETFEKFDKGDLLLIQNELNMTEEIINKGHEKGMKIFINTSPINKEMLDLPLDKIDYVVANEVEAEMLIGDGNPDNFLSGMRKKFPNAVIVVTLGSEGCQCIDLDGNTFKIPAHKVKVVATTSAGDTFMGYLLSAIAKGESIEDALKLSTKASALCVTRAGTTNSIPTYDEVVGWDPA
jgi:ribokinase